jgi:hypothetical protein
MNNEPVAWTDGHFYVSFDKTGICSIPLYTHPVKELTDEEIDFIFFDLPSGHSIQEFARAILKRASEK